MLPSSLNDHVIVGFLLHVLAMLSNSTVHPELGVQDVTEAENYEALLRQQNNKYT